MPTVPVEVLRAYITRLRLGITSRVASRPSRSRGYDAHSVVHRACWRTAGPITSIHSSNDVNRQGEWKMKYKDFDITKCAISDLLRFWKASVAVISVAVAWALVAIL